MHSNVDAIDTDLRGATWFEPRFVVEVFHGGIGRQQLPVAPGGGNRLRFAQAPALPPSPAVAGSGSRLFTPDEAISCTRAANTLGLPAMIRSPKR